MIPVDLPDQSDPLQKQSGMDAMFGDQNAFSRFRVICGNAAIRLREPAAAVALGAVIGQAFTVWRLLTGGTNAAAAMALAATAVGLILESGFAGYSGSRIRTLRVVVPATAALSVLCWFLPTLFRIALWSGYDLSEALIHKDGADFSAFLFRNMNSLAVIAAFSGFVAFWWRCLALSDQRSAPSRFVWIALGICSLLIHSAMTFPMAATVSALLLLSLTCELFLRTPPLNSAVNSLSTTDRENGSDVLDWASNSNLSSSVSIRRSASLAVCGAVIAAASMIFSLLVPFSLPLILLSVLTVSILWRLLSIRIVSRILSAERLQISAMLLLAAFPLFSSALINLNFSLRTELESASAILILQALQYGMLLTTILLMRQCVRLLPSNIVSSAPEPFFRQHLSLIVLGAAAGFALLVYSVDAGVMLGIGTAFFAVLIISGQHWIPGRRVVAAAGAGVVMLPTLLISFDTEHAGTILFSERSLEASRVGVNRDLIPQSDAGRLAERRMTALGEVQVWRRSGEVFEFRLNGRSLGYVSRDPEITPQPAEEIIPTILMMSMHSQPGRILILGDDTGVGLRVCSHFPVQRIVALRSSPEMTELAERYTWKAAEVSPLTDERITIRHLAGPEALQSRPSVPFDVLMAAPSAADNPESLAYWSEEFFTAAKGQLSDSGVLCQRFHMRRLASGDLKSLMATALTSFQHVIVVQTARNEMALLATNATNGLPGRNVLKRLQQDYFRREIGTALRDWSQVATLPLLDARDTGGIFAHEAIPDSFSVSDGHTAMSFPFRTLQHQDLTAELQAAFTPHQMTIAEVVPASESHQEISRRQTALAQQVEILAAMPDEPWAYRKSLRTELQRNPRPPRDVVRSGEVERVMHPADQFRQDYFLTLGKSIQRVKSGDHSYEAFRGLVDFTVQYEPLLSLFAYYEIVRLHEVAQHPVPHEEFRHRLHTVFCTDQSDASIRPVVLAMKQLIEQPEVAADDAERFDLMNSLIQKLIERWEARTAWVPKSAKRVQDDVEYSVTLTNQALERMSEWADAAEYSESAMLNRRRYISAALTAPLRTYRDQVLAHMLRTEKAVQPVTEDDPDSEPLLIEQNTLNTN